MRFYSSFTQLLANLMRSEITLKAFEAQALAGEVVLLTSAGLEHVLGTDKAVPVEVTWTGVENIKVAYADKDANGLVSIDSLPSLLRDRWLRFRSVLVKLNTRQKIICNINADLQNWYIHTIVRHGHQFMFNYTTGWDGDITPDLQGAPPAEVYVNLAHLIELDSHEQALAHAAVAEASNL